MREPGITLLLARAHLFVYLILKFYFAIPCKFLQLLPHAKVKRGWIDKNYRKISISLVWTPKNNDRDCPKIEKSIFFSVQQGALNMQMECQTV